MAKPLTLSQAFQGMILEKQAAGLSAHTISDYRNTLAKAQLFFPNDPPFTSLTRERLVKFFAWLGNDYIARPDGAASRGEFKLGAKSRLNIHTNLSALWTWAVACGYAETNIVRSISAPDVEQTVIDPLTIVEIAAMLKACDTARTDQMRQAKKVSPARATAVRDRMIIMLLFDTGLRAQELCDIVLDDLDMSQQKSGFATARAINRARSASVSAAPRRSGSTSKIVTMSAQSQPFHCSL